VNYTESELLADADKGFVMLSRLPMSPSSNSQYKLVPRGAKTYLVGSAELNKFKREMQTYEKVNWKKIKEVRTVLDDWIKIQGLKLSVQTIFYFKESRLFTEKGTVKKLDVSNRIKAFHDCLCKMLKIDDSMFFDVIAKKRIIFNEEHEGVEVMLHGIRCP
jgi:Holliday junction resolvase RusA-like endonuclease